MEGVFVGAIQAEGMNNTLACLSGAENVAEDIYNAVQEFEKETASSVTAGLKLLAKAISTVADDIKSCEGIKADFTKLKAMLYVYNSPYTFAYHVGKDLLLNGVSIYQNIKDGIAAYKA